MVVSRNHQRKSKINLPLEIWALPPKHLLLNGYTRRFTARLDTIGDLLAALQGYNKLFPPTAGAARREIELALTGLGEAMEQSGLGGWDHFRESGPLPS
jgi:hypothetical protein